MEDGYIGTFLSYLCNTSINIKLFQNMKEIYKTPINTSLQVYFMTVLFHWFIYIYIYIYIFIIFMVVMTVAL